MPDGTRLTRRDLARALELREAFRALLQANRDRRCDEAATARFKPDCFPLALATFAESSAHHRAGQTINSLGTIAAASHYFSV